MEIDPDKLAVMAGTGGKEAFGKLYELYFDKIYRFIYYRTLNREIAEDLCSKSFMKALESIGSFNGGKGSFGSWIYKIASNNLTDHFRKSGRFEMISGVWELPSCEDPVVDVHNRLYWEKLKPVFDELSPDKKEIIIMRVWDDLSFGEIAEITGKSEAACKMSFKRTLEGLRKSVPLSMLMLFILFKSTVL